MHMCKDCAVSEEKAWNDGRDVFVRHLGLDLLAEDTISELLSDNYILLERLPQEIINK